MAAKGELDRCLMGFLAALVQIGVLKKVKLGFLMVGHTHEDIDQVFSRYSVWLKQHEALTLDQLMRGFENCLKSKPKAKRTNSVYEFMEWLDIKGMKGHSRPHVFKFCKTDDKVCLQYKKWSTDKLWMDCKGGSLLNDSMDFTKPVQPITPTLDRVPEKTKTDVQTLARFLEKDAVSMWWTNFLHKLENEVTNPSKQVLHLRTLIQKKNAEEVQAAVHGDVLSGLDGINAPISEIVLTGRRKGHQRHQTVSEAGPEVQDTEFHKGDLIAAFTTDPESDFGYYLMKVCRPARVLKKEERDNWGQLYQPGAKVI